MKHYVYDRMCENFQLLKMIVIFSVFFLVAAIFPQHTHAQCPVSNTVFGNGEQISYTVSYNWGPVWVDAGLVTFSVNNEIYFGKPSWHLRSTGKSFMSYDMLFKVRDYYDSWIDPETFRSFNFRRNISEGGYTLLNTLIFEQSGERVIFNTKRNNQHLKTDTLQLPNCVFDILAAIYYTRTLDFSDLRPQGKKQITVLIDDAYFEIYIRPIGKEIVQSTDGKRYRCIKFAAKMVQGTIFKGDEDVTVWVTDDANKIPVYIEAKIIVGTVKAYMKETKGLKNPMTSLIR